MKTEEQVLKEWALGRIEFRFDRRRYFSQQEFLLLSSVLFSASSTVLKLLLNHIRFHGGVGKQVYDIVLQNESDDMLIEVRKKVKRPKFKHLKRMEQLARFDSLDELYNHVTGRDQRREEF